MSSGPPPRLLAVGQVALDQRFDVAALPSGPGKSTARGHHTSVGGLSANAAVAAARLGAAVVFAGVVGDDDAATEFRRHFAREGVDARGLCAVAGARSSVSAVIVDAAGERLIVNHRGDALQRAPAFDPTLLEGVQAVLTDPRCPAWAEAALSGARRRGLPSVLDADTAPREDLARLAGLAGWAVFSAPGLAAFHPGTIEDGLAAALAAGAGAAAVTLGPQGLCWQRPAQPCRRLAAFTVAPVIDTTGAGDVFHGAFGVALALGLADEPALRLAAAAAALKCLQPGGVQGAPSRAAVEQLLRQP